MDAKYLAEIKTRDNAELPKTAAPVFRDRHALLAEVERLGKETATLKRALKLMSRTACGEVRGTMPEWDMIGCVPDKNCMKENPCKGSNNQCHECWMRYFIQQAQEQEEKE